MGCIPLLSETCFRHVNIISYIVNSNIILNNKMCEIDWFTKYNLCHYRWLYFIRIIHKISLKLLTVKKEILMVNLLQTRF